MGLGSTAKKVQKLGDLAEKLYQRVEELRQSLHETRTELEATSQQVDDLDAELAEQRALLEALADEQGIDADEVVADAAAATDQGEGERDVGGSGADEAADAPATDD